EPIGWAPAGAPDAASSWQAWRRGVVHGPQSTFYQAGPKPPGAVLGASFRPGAAGAVLGAPPAALLDRHVAIDDLWGTWGRTLHARLAESRSPHDALSCLERALVARLDARAPMHPAVAQALD